MKKVGIIGYRGMVGSVLAQRMGEEGDYKHFKPHFFSTSQANKPGPVLGEKTHTYKDAKNLQELREMDIILTTQGSSYTEEVHPQLRSQGWDGYWIDAASALRGSSKSLLVLDPVNKKQIEDGIEDGLKDLIGANCTVSLMLMALGGLVKKNKIEWISSMTYQAASGAGARNMKELLDQMGDLGHKTYQLRMGKGKDLLEMERKASEVLKFSSTHPKELFGHPLAGSLLPYIDSPMENGQSREEWKGMIETNKILGLSGDQGIPVDGICVRIGALRCHSQGLTIKLKEDLALEEVIETIGTSNDWVKIIPNEKEETLSRLTPTTVSGTLDIPIGRIRKMNLGPHYLTAFTVGDQLLWGAAEPLRRALRMIL